MINSSVCSASTAVGMVKILANGDIVPDDDPRAQQTTSRGGSAEQNRQGRIQHDQNNQAYGQGRQVSIFDNLNERLLQAGIPRFNVGPYVIEPIVSVGLLLALLLTGVKGLMFGALLFLVVKWSSGAGNNPTGGAGGGGHRRGWAARGGHRLGR